MNSDGPPVGKPKCWVGQISVEICLTNIFVTFRGYITFVNSDAIPDLETAMARAGMAVSAELNKGVYTLKIIGGREFTK